MTSSTKAAAGRLALAGAALGCLVLGCSGDAEPSPARVWVGDVVGTDIKVALAERSEGAAVLFFCGGDESYTMSTRWFAEGAQLERPFAFEDSGWRVDGAVKESEAAGSVHPPSGDSWSWTAAAAKSSTIAGLYEGTGPCGKLGLIVSQPAAADTPSGQGACVRVEGDALIVEQVNPIRLGESFTGEISVTVASAPDALLTVRRVAASAK